MTSNRRSMRGFPMPETQPERLQHEKQRMIVVRLTAWEMSLMRLGYGVDGRFVLSPSADGSYDLVRVSE